MRRLFTNAFRAWYRRKFTKQFPAIMDGIFAQLDKFSLCLVVELIPGGGQHALGSGCFFMRRDIVLTARHVVLEAFERGKQMEIVYGSDEGRLCATAPQGFFFHPEIDIALVRVSLDGLKVQHPFFPSHFPLHKGAIGIGYDKGASDNTARHWTFAANKIERFESEKRERYHGSIEYTLQFEAPWMSPGCSGGPVITQGGGVAAVLIEDFSKADDTAAGTPKSFGRATSVYPVLESFRSPFE